MTYSNLRNMRITNPRLNIRIGLSILLVLSTLSCGLLSPESIHEKNESPTFTSTSESIGPSLAQSSTPETLLQNTPIRPTEIDIYTSVPPEPTNTPPSEAYGPEFEIHKTISHENRSIVSLKNIHQVIPLARSTFPDQTTHVKWSHDSSQLAVGTYGKIYIYSINLELDTVINADGYALAFSTSAPLLAYSDKYGKKIVIFNLEDGSIQAEMDCDLQVSSLLFSPDGNLLISGHSPDLIVLWDVSSGQKLSQYKRESRAPDQPIEALAFTPDGRYLASGFEKILVISDILERTVVSDLRSSNASIQSLSISPNGDKIATASAGPSIQFWSLEYELPLFSVDGKVLPSSPFPVIFSNNGDILFAGDEHSNLLALSVDKPEIFASFSAHSKTMPLADMAITPDGTLLATLSLDRSLVLWGIVP